GLTLDNGIVCDETCAAVGVDGVVATGDIARWPNPRFEAVMRIEHSTNAAEQAEAAAATLLAGPGSAQPFGPIPYFWSDQYDVKYASVGMIGPDDDVEVVEGSVEDRKFVATYTQGGKLVGAFSCNHPRALMQWRKQIEELTALT
ncbi:MAG: NAD(P)/FAD-dependent oxidoreductase, partial [Actinobacteria bacterium]|nr:NAD(P)/FAD-dependent oxidoreductase [Actinomycetota bacterium]